MRYPCLVLDHDDTVVKSTPEIHYPAFLEILANLRPALAPPDLETFMEYCSEPGYFRYCAEIIGLTPEEQPYENEIWYKHLARHVPAVYEGFPALLRRYRGRGGRIFVVTHSQSDVALRDWRENGLGEPDGVFGAELPEEHRKPYPWPLEQIRLHWGFSKDEMLLVDDLMTGLTMAKRDGILAVGAGWSHISPRVRERVRAACDVYLTEVCALEPLLFGASGADQAPESP